MADGKLVYIKRLATSSEELRIALLFSEEARRADPRNHAVPILDVLQDPDNADISYVVMPLLHYFDEPRFEDVSDAIDFVTQMLEVYRAVSIRLPSLTNFSTGSRVYA